jgi:hypothetical protein
MGFSSQGCLPAIFPKVSAPLWLIAGKATSLKCPYFCMAYRSACRRASAPVKISTSLPPSSSNHSTPHWPSRSSKTMAGLVITVNPAG